MNSYNIRKLSADEINQTDGGITRKIECYYWKDTETLATHGSSKSCPASYSDVFKNPSLTLIDKRQDRAFYGLSLNIK